ncbi:Prophage CP4-57 integrase [Vibrio scophthalmi]|uniref:integrase domain-containing protein n=1 Tax=Vibrio scophthalmi TaxID=45658 RepID=UPI000809740C|nr:integrase domain-containing protein [Vibrio scophthalmi]ANS87899.1 Prophage CP4-57 integrase [Vibrio scophthalmi]
MARIAKQLTDKQLKNAKSKISEYVLSDGAGLQCRIMPSGAKTWRLVYKNPEIGKQSRITLGHYPALSIANARKLADEQRTLIALGIDPKSHKQKIQNEYIAINQNTLFNVSRDWFEIKATEVTPDYANDIWRSLELHIFPELQDHPISTLTAPIVINVLKPIEAKGTLETVKRLSQRLNEIMTYAVNCGLAPANPLRGIKAAFRKPTIENMKSLKPEELPELMSSIAHASIKRTTRCLIEFQLHTMTRPNEAAGARWDEFDFENKIWIIPAHRMKKRIEHRIPLTNEVLNILEKMALISRQREYVFPADRNPKKATNSQTANAALKRMGFSGRLVSHGLRALASTVINEQKLHDSDLIEAALAHIGGDEIRRTYNRTDYLEPRREMMSWWSKWIVDASHGSFSITKATE